MARNCRWNWRSRPFTPGTAPIFTGVLRDITARKHAEATRARLAAIVDSSDDAIFSMALDDTILTWNARRRTAVRLHGERDDRPESRTPRAGREERRARPDHGHGPRAGRPVSRSRRDALRKDGSVVDISLMISPMTDADRAHHQRVHDRAGHHEPEEGGGVAAR